MGNIFLEAQWARQAEDRRKEAERLEARREAERKAAAESEAKQAAANQAAAERAKHLAETGGAPIEALTEKYRPRQLADIVGQPAAVSALTSFVKRPYPTAYLLYGASGTGKTSAALALAAELGCDVGKQEFGGVWQVPSGEQSVANVRQLLERLHFVPFYGSGWKVCIVNEADNMAPQAEAVWLDALENLPSRTVVIFTTNRTDKMSDRFMDRCQLLKFDSAVTDDSRAAAAELLGRICEREIGNRDAVAWSDVQLGIVRDGCISFRRVVQNISRLLHQSAGRQVA